MKTHFPKDFQRWVAMKQRNITCKIRRIKTVKVQQHNLQCEKKYMYIDSPFLL